MNIKTLQDACAFVKAEKVCTIFPSEKVPYTSLYKHVDLPIVGIGYSRSRLIEL